MRQNAAKIVCRPVTAERWADVLELFGESGAYAGCWCMWWRVTSSVFDAENGAGLRARFQQLVEEGAEPGLLAYVGDRPVGWVAVAPRGEYGRMQRSPKLKPVDDLPVWMVSCFYIDRRDRGTGVAGALLDAAVTHARRRGAEAIEGVPIDTRSRTPAAAGMFTGSLAMFEAAGFTEVERRGGRPIVRRELRGRRRGSGSQRS
jgi:GNAT superfamily N-acetyltransferase